MAEVHASEGISDMVILRCLCTAANKNNFTMVCLNIFRSGVCNSCLRDIILFFVHISLPCALIFFHLLPGQCQVSGLLRSLYKMAENDHRKYQLSLLLCVCSSIAKQAISSTNYTELSYWEQEFSIYFSPIVWCLQIMSKLSKFV